MPKQYKIDAVAEIESKLESNAGVFVVAYNGLTVLQAQELRKQLRECGAQMKVYKNNLVRIALEMCIRDSRRSSLWTSPRAASTSAPSTRSTS